MEMAIHPKAGWLGFSLVSLVCIQWKPSALTCVTPNSEVYSVMEVRGVRMDSNSSVHRWLCENPLFQDEDWIKIFSPIGPWERGMDSLPTLYAQCAEVP